MLRRLSTQMMVQTNIQASATTSEPEAPRGARIVGGIAGRVVGNLPRFLRGLLGRPAGRQANDATLPDDRLTVTRFHRGVPITLLTIRANLDATTYEAVIAKGRVLVGAGAQHLLVDLSEVPMLTNAGLVALHNLARLCAGKPLTTIEDGWSAFHEMERDCQQGLQTRVRLLSPQPAVARALEQTGLDGFFAIHDDLNSALVAFEG